MNLVNERNSRMGNFKDEEIALLTEEQAGPTSRGISRKATTWSVAMTLLIFIGLLAVIFAIFRIEDHTQDLVFRARRDSLRAPFNVLVVGDWGRQGKYNQSLVANQANGGIRDMSKVLTGKWIKRSGQLQMGRVGQDLEVNFIISTGDNFYNSGLDDINDPLFEKSFTKIYQASSLQKTWYAVLGNHDYRGNPEIQVDKRLRNRDSRWFCDYTYTLSIDLDHPFDGRSDTLPSSVEFFFIDTSPFEENYWTPDSKEYHWTRAIPRKVVIANQLKNLTEDLETSTATWKIVVGHHTIFSYGNHGNTPELVEKVLPILKANNVDLYVNGHDHTLQDIKRDDSDIHFVTTGGGSKAWKGELPPSNIRDSKLFYDGQGFISISITPTVLHLNYYDIFGTIMHQFELKK